MQRRKQTKDDPSVCYTNEENVLTLIMIPVDEISFMLQDEENLEKHKIHLRKELEVKYVACVLIIICGFFLE